MKVYIRSLYEQQKACLGLTTKTISSVVQVRLECVKIWVFPIFEHEEIVIQIEFLRRYS